MYSAVGTRENIKIIDSAEYGGVKIEVMEYQHLFGSTGTSAAMDLYFMEKQNIRARQVAVYLSNDMVTVEPGAMSYFRGPLEMVSGVTAGKPRQWYVGPGAFFQSFFDSSTGQRRNHCG